MYCQDDHSALAVDSISLRSWRRKGLQRSLRSFSIRASWFRANFVLHARDQSFETWPGLCHGKNDTRRFPFTGSVRKVWNRNFFHFSGNSLRRVHVFLRHLEKMSHQLFEPEMGLSTLLAKKGQKGQKIFSDSGRKICFWKYSCPGTGNGFFLPLSEIFLIFLPSLWKLCFGLFVFFGLFFTFFGLFGLWGSF